MPVQVIARELLEGLVERARRSPRRRINHNFHARPEENPNRFLNALLRGSYIRPHRHCDPPKPESFLVLSGTVAFFMFDDGGHVVEQHLIGGDGNPLGIDLSAGLWHTLAAVSETAVCYEVKPGPYSPATDKEFAPWAPAEGEAGAAAYLETLMSYVKIKLEC